MGFNYLDYDPDEILSMLNAVASEAIRSEKAYVADLRKIVEKFVQPLRDLALNGKPTISLNDIRDVFSNVELIYELNKKLLSDLELVGVEGDVGRVFCEFSPFFKMYHMYYENCEESLDLVDKLLRKNRRFAKFCANRGMHVKSTNRRRTLGHGQSMGSLLIKPVQRLPRYTLLLRELLKFTHPDQPDHPRRKALEAAIEGVMESTKKCEEFMAVKEEATAALQLRHRFRGQSVKLEPSLDRALIKEGTLWKRKHSGGFSQRVFLLFNDTLAYGTTGNFSGTVTLSHVLALETIDVRGDIQRVVDLVTNLSSREAEKYTNDARCFALVSPSGAHILRADSVFTKEAWVESISEAVDKAKVLLIQKSSLAQYNNEALPVAGTNLPSVAELAVAAKGTSHLAVSIDSKKDVVDDAPKLPSPLRKMLHSRRVNSPTITKTTMASALSGGKNVKTRRGSRRRSHAVVCRSESLQGISSKLDTMNTEVQQSGFGLGLGLDVGRNDDSNTKKMSRMAPPTPRNRGNRGKHLSDEDSDDFIQKSLREGLIKPTQEKGVYEFSRSESNLSNASSIRKYSGYTPFNNKLSHTKSLPLMGKDILNFGLSGGETLQKDMKNLKMIRASSLYVPSSNKYNIAPVNVTDGKKKSNKRWKTKNSNNFVGNPNPNRKFGTKLPSFRAMDLNGDGIITEAEYLSYKNSYENSLSILHEDENDIMANSDRESSNPNPSSTEKYRTETKHLHGSMRELIKKHKFEKNRGSKPNPNHDKFVFESKPLSRKKHRRKIRF